MERTVPSTGTEEIELFQRTYYSLLRTTSDVSIRTLEEAHAGMNSVLHPEARSSAPDMSAFIYAILRLPQDMHQVKLFVLGQSLDAFQRGGFPEVDQWQVVEIPARRRLCYYDGVQTVACFIASQTDIDDVVPLLTAFQIEWNKLHDLLNKLPPEIEISEVGDVGALREKLAGYLQISLEDLNRLQIIWGAGFLLHLRQIRETRLRLKLRLLSGSLSEYRRATRVWWKWVVEAYPALLERPIYFVSSNNHSLANLLSGFALANRTDLLQFLEESGRSALQQEWQKILADQVKSSRENYFYYLLKKYIELPENQEFAKIREQAECDCGIQRIPPKNLYDLETQVIDLARLDPAQMDPRLSAADLSYLSKSDALILNIDYPLGLAAYNILTKISEQTHRILGVYILGKAATLNGVIGDIMIPNVVHDEHTRNTYLFRNAFSAADVNAFLTYGTVLDNQKSVTVRGTFLQTARFMDVFYREGYTDIEMEAGPYLSAVYETTRPKRHPIDEIVSFNNLPFDLGILHYASDTPLSKGKNLGAMSLSYFGMDPTYATSLTILQRILQLERIRLTA